MWTIEQLKYSKESEDKIEFKRGEHGNVAYDGGNKSKPADRRRCIIVAGETNRCDEAHDERYDAETERDERTDAWQNTEAHVTSHVSERLRHASHSLLHNRIGSEAHHDDECTVENGEKRCEIAERVAAYMRPIAQSKLRLIVAADADDTDECE